ncbi:MAG: metal-dependent hydrolase [Gemmatimonadaceae bacterium]|nr:metal-dependent hydrolase [Gemmatimonadaceae bacterium]
MDNVCHTLVGAALGEAGLKHRSALGAATLMIAANFPDIDIVAVPLGHGLDFRRGWTHGVPALVVLPFVLTGLMLAWDRFVRRRRNAAAAPPRAKQILLLAAIGIVTHPVLDWLNVYGMRWLMPFSDRWFYGDALFIVDPWIWGMLAVGTVWARRRWRAARDPAERDAAQRPARWALAGVATYIVAMLAANASGRRIVQRDMAAAGFDAHARFMVAPVPVTPFRRLVVFDEGAAYRFGTLAWRPSPRFALDEHLVPKGADDPAVSVARATPNGRAFLGWARFPFFVVERRRADSLVRIGDARYTVDAEESWAAAAIPLPGSPGGR